MIRFKGTGEYREWHRLRVSSHENTPIGSLFQALLLWKSATVHRAKLIEHGFLLTRSLATTSLEEAVGTSFSPGVIIGPVGRGSGAAQVAKACPLFSITLLSAGGVTWESTTSTGVGVAMTPTARMVAKKDAKKILAFILNERKLKIEISFKSRC